MDEENNEESRGYQTGIKDAKRKMQKERKKKERAQTAKTFWNKLPTKVKLIILGIGVGAIVLIILLASFVYYLDELEKQKEEEERKKEENLQYDISDNILQEYLVQFENNYVKKDYYKIERDSIDGHQTIEIYGILWESNADRFNFPGKVKQGNIEKQVNNIKNFVNGVLTNSNNIDISIDGDSVSKVFDIICQERIDYVQSQTEGITLSEQQLVALTSVAYNFGNLPTRDGKTFKDVYNEASKRYSINSWQHNMYVWDNWWSKLKGGAPGHITRRDCEFETYVKGNYEFTLDRKEYMFYTQQQLDACVKDGKRYAIQRPLRRNTESIESIFKSEGLQKNVQKRPATPEYSSNGRYDGETVKSAGYTFPHYHQGNYADIQFGDANHNIASSGCGPSSMAMILAGLCGDPSIDPISFSNNLKEFYGKSEPYYSSGEGTNALYLCNNAFLKKYYNCISTNYYYDNYNWNALYKAMEQNKCVFGFEEGHRLAIIPPPAADKAKRL